MLKFSVSRKLLLQSPCSQRFCWIRYTYNILQGFTGICVIVLYISAFKNLSNMLKFKSTTGQWYDFEQFAYISWTLFPLKNWCQCTCFIKLSERVFVTVFCRQKLRWLVLYLLDVKHLCKFDSSMRLKLSFVDFRHQFPRHLKERVTL
jgi:hypothetical protein